MSKSGLTEYEAVIAVARRGNFRAAAVDLGMSPSALSHAVAALETRLRARLFNRTTRSVSLSEAGEQFVARVAPALTEIMDAVDAINDLRDTPTGLLRINTSVGAARQIMQPIIFEYLRRHPQMKVDLVTEGRLIDIVLDGFDAGIRLRESVPQDMIAIPFGPDQRYAVVASPEYFRHNPVPETPADIARHHCIRSRLPSGTIYRWEFARCGEEAAIDVQGPLTLDEPSLIIEAACSGLGLAYVAEWNVAEALAAGRLVRVLEDWTPPFPGLCLYYPGRRHVPAGLRAMVNLIREQTASTSRSRRPRRPPSRK
jgi:DNA-binding transcriptional LysR family regulator